MRTGAAIGLIAGVGLLALVAGVAIGGAGTESENEKLRKRIASVERASDRAQANAEDAQGNAAKAQSDAADSERRAKAQLDKQQAELDKRKADLDAQASQLAERERAVSGAEVEAKRNSFGDGVHVVGTDIQAGTYKAATAGSDCYWAKLQSDEGIIDNDLPQGPTTVTIESSVAKFKSAGCGTWTKVG